MNLTQQTVEKILKQVEKKRLSSRKAFEKLKSLPYETFSFAKVDHHRSFRKGFPEAVYSPGKTVPQLETIIRSIKRSGHSLILTRLEKNIYSSLRKKIPGLRYSEHGRMAYLKVGATPRGCPVCGSQSLGFHSHSRRARGPAPTNGFYSHPDVSKIAVVTAGTSDIPVAEEAAITLELIGKEVIRIYDCGVAGLHRLLDQLPKLKRVKAIICVAGMEGALPSVMAGLVDKPVIAVPTSVGYGASFKGLAPLLTMLSSCAQGIAVVNIDNGFGAACFAASIA